MEMLYEVLECSHNFSKHSRRMQSSKFLKGELTAAFSLIDVRQTKHSYQQLKSTMGNMNPGRKLPHLQTVLIKIQPRPISEHFVPSGILENVPDFQNIYSVGGNSLGSLPEDSVRKFQSCRTFML